MCMGRRNLKHGITDEILGDIIYLITKKSCFWIAGLQHVVPTAMFVSLPRSQKAHVSLGLGAFLHFDLECLHFNEYSL